MADLITLHDNHLWILACRLGKRMYEIAGMPMFEDDRFLAENIRRASMNLTTFIAEAHNRAPRASGYHLISNALAYARELGHYVYLAKRAGMSPQQLAEIETLLDEVWAAFAHQLDQYALEKTA